MNMITQHTGIERFFDRDELIVSKTDTKGHITYANHTFLEIAGYTESEVMGQPHNMIRHPNMPRAVFELLWRTIQERKEIFAYVVNSAKNGDYYWVIAHVTPSFENGQIVGYHSTRRVPNPQTIKSVIEPLYAQLKSIEDSNPNRKAGTQAAFDALVGILTEKGVSYEEFICDLMKND
jgi:PAS domain S-box-containing protein